MYLKVMAGRRRQQETELLEHEVVDVGVDYF